MIASIGDLLLDISIVPQGRLRQDDDTSAHITVGGGGQAANFCAWAAAIGEPVRLIARVGNDERGRSLVAELETRGVDVRAVWANEATGAIAVLIEPDGKRTMATHRGASTGLKVSDLKDAWFKDVKLLHVPAYSLFVEPLATATKAAIELVREGGGMVAIDLSSAAGLREYGAHRMAYLLGRLKPEVLLATDKEAEALGVPIENLAQVPVVKLGSKGCMVFGVHIPSPEVEVVDPTGAGDAFAAAFCVAWLRGSPPVESAEEAVALAAESVTKAGARPN